MSSLPPDSLRAISGGVPDQLLTVVDDSDALFTIQSDAGFVLREDFVHAGVSCSSLSCPEACSVLERLEGILSFSRPVSLPGSNSTEGAHVKEHMFNSLCQTKSLSLVCHLFVATRKKGSLQV
jgi:hypothetical protein